MAKYTDRLKQRLDQSNNPLQKIGAVVGYFFESVMAGSRRRHDKQQELYSNGAENRHEDLREIDR